MTTHEFTCTDCKQHKTHTDEHTTGYATFGGSNAKVCFACCGLRDAAYMAKHGKNTMYLTLKQLPGDNFKSWQVTNWPGTLAITVSMRRKGRHNIAGCRYDVWFRFQGRDWHGVQYGDNTQLCRVKRLKVVSA